MKLGHPLTPHTKKNPKWIKDLNIRPDTIKPLVGNLARMLFDINHTNIVCDPSPRVMEIKINKTQLTSTACVQQRKP